MTEVASGISVSQLLVILAYDEEGESSGRLSMTLRREGVLYSNIFEYMNLNAMRDESRMGVFSCCQRDACTTLSRLY